jgi:hypothetical protein
MGVQTMGRGVSPVSLGLAAALAMGLAYAVVLAQPSLVHMLRGMFSQLSGGARSVPWALPVVAAGIAVAGGAIGVIVLATVARLAQRNPFLWLGPVLVAFTMIVLAGVSASLPWPALPLPAFASLSGVALLGGGAALQMPGRASKVAGALLIALPLLALLVGYGSSPLGLAASLGASGKGATLVIVILGLTSVGIAATALIARAEDLESVVHMRKVLEHQRLQLIDAVELGRASEVRVREAERRMELLEHGIVPTSADDDAALRAMRGDSGGGALQWALAAAAGMLCLACGALYFGLYQPAARKLSVQGGQLAQVSQKHAAELAALRASFEAEKTSFGSALEGERSGIAAARASVEEAQSKLAACEAAQPKLSEQAEPAVAPAPKAQKHKVARAATTARAAKRRPPARKAAPPAAGPPTSAAARPGVPDLDAKTNRALRESESRGDDDPLSGL